MRLSTVATVAAILLAAGCNNSTSPSTGGRSTVITVGNNFYSLVPDTVASGAQITWTWATPSAGHTVTWDSGPGTLPAGSATMTSGTYNATLTTPGTYHYHCLVHGAAMSGVVVVQ
ncbi:MAG TPA: plastocyanin/azurin family copper-binding protein [Gemmatimonadales bacterium]|nr:plastocyanin/azurin family copper-binding protein [Gemmatimonadales bacterium]